MRKIIVPLVLLAVMALAGCVDVSGLMSTPAAEAPAQPEATMAVAEVQSATATPSPEVVRPIVFASTRAGGDTFDIFVMNPDGSGLARLTDDPAADERQPVWSPDLSQIAFVSNQTGRNQVYVLSLADYTTEPLTEQADGAIWPTWSAGGSEIAYIVDEGEQNRIEVLNVDSGELTFEQTLPIGDLSHLDWSPDGSRFLFAARPTANARDLDVFSFDISSERLVNLTNRPANDRYPSWSPSGDRVLFQSDQNGNEDIFVMQANGALQTPLTTDAANDLDPAWSGGGNQVVFVSDREGSANLFTMTDSGADISVVSPVDARDSQPHWQPDPVQVQEEIVYSGGVLTGLSNLLVVNVGGSGLTELTASNTSDDTMPDWSPDGQQVVFASSREGNYDIYLLDRAAGNNQVQRLTDNPGRDFHPAWSPDGSRIAFESNRDDQWDIWLMDADGANPRQLTLDTSNDGNPAWSPDGSRILFSSDRSGNFDIWMLDVDGDSEPENLTQTEVDEFFPAWSPDGNLIAYRVYEDGQRQLWVMNSRGQARRQLLLDDADSDQPSWSPDSLRLAFVSNRRFNDEGDGITFQLFIYDLTTRDVRRLSPPGVNAAYPDWKPRTGR